MEDSALKDFSWPITTLLYDDYEALRTCLDHFSSTIRDKQLIVFGAGIRGSLFAVLLKEFGYTDLLFVDNNEQKWGGVIHGHPIVAPTELPKYRKNAVVLIATEAYHSIAEQLTKLGFSRDQDFLVIETDHYGSYIDEMLRDCTPTTLILGDCGLSHISLFDKNKDNLSIMLKNKLGSDKTKVLAMHGMGMRSFYHVIKTQVEHNPSITNLFITINFGVFTGKRHLLPRTQHVGLLERVYNISNQKDEEFLDYLKIAQGRASSFKLDFFSETQDRSVSTHLSRNRLSLFFQVNYMYKIRKNTEDMEYLSRIINYAAKHKIKVIPFIPPVNYEFAETLLGNKFKEKYNTILGTFTEWMSEENTPVLDMSYLLQASQFGTAETIDETINYDGRQKVLEALMAYTANHGVVK